ncbi:MAG: shikimate kinase [Desulfotalea sp.]
MLLIDEKGMTMSMIFLVGYRAVGKSTIGKVLAKTMGKKFVDLDEMICEQAGRTVAEIVTADGWDGFRVREKTALQAMLSMRNTVVATGGGAVIHEDLWPELQKRGPVVWLQLSKEGHYSRLKGNELDENRPSLIDTNLKDEIDKVLNERWPLYQKASSLILDTEGQSVDRLVEMIIENCQSENIN